MSQHLATTKYRGSGCSDASSMSLLSLPLLASPVSIPYPACLLLRAVANRDSQEGCRCAIIFAWFRSAGQIKTADGTQRRVRLRSALRSKTEFPRTGGDTCEYAPRRGRRDSIPGSQGRISSPRRDKDVNRWRSSRGRADLRSDVCRSEIGFCHARFGHGLALGPFPMFHLLTKLWMISGGNWPRDQRRDW